MQKMLPSRVPTGPDILATIRGMDEFSSPGPDGFIGSFFSFWWPVVGPEVISVVQTFFQNGYIMPHFNSKIIILIPKLEDSEGISDYRPIALTNFAFKIMADRLGTIASRIVSLNQSGFIKGRNIIDPIDYWWKWFKKRNKDTAGLYGKPFPHY